MLAVRDTGSGIAPEEIDKVFDPFFTTIGMANHSGLGMSMVEGFAHQSGGHISVESEVGAGTTFRLALSERSALEPVAE